MTKKKRKKKVNKALAQSVVRDSGYGGISSKENGRGYQITTLSRLLQVTGKDKNQNRITTTTDQPIFYLTPGERERIMRLCSPILGIISGRMNRISGIDFNIISDKKQEERLADMMKGMYQMSKEFEKSPDIRHKIARQRFKQKLMNKLPDLIDDMSNFNRCLIRWKKRINYKNIDKANQIKDWLKQPNRNDHWASFIKKWVQNDMLHGTAAVYKERINDTVTNLHNLPGGTVIPFRTEYVTSQSVYIQYVMGREPLIYHPDEISFSQYIPTAYQSYGMIPIEALINKITETLLFDDLMAKQADGTKFPEKMIIIADSSPFGNPDQELKLPMNIDEQKRIEEKINTRIEGGIMTFSGNSVNVVDLTRENTMQMQSQRQKDIREEVALVFNMSDQEANLMGAKRFSSNDTASQQSEIEQSKGTNPIKRQIEHMINYDVLPYTFGREYSFEFETTKNELQEIQLEQAKMNTNTYSINEIREQRGDMPFDGDEFDKPKGASENQQQGTELNPLNVRNLGG